MRMRWHCAERRYTYRRQPQQCGYLGFAGTFPHADAGRAPPDMFAVKGQNWELPTYNWDMIKRTGFDWWKNDSLKCPIISILSVSTISLGFSVSGKFQFIRWKVLWDICSLPYRCTLNEFAEKGIWFDYNRFCKPYITDAILWDFFGEEASWVKANCLQIEDGWVLHLKTPYLSQQNVEKCLLMEKFRNV